MPDLSRRRVTALVTVIVTAILGTPSPARAAPLDATTEAERQVDGARVPALAWAPCGDFAVGFECATARVPLDYDRPHGPTIDLAVTRLPATDRAGRMGSLFVNPGGPGGSGVGFTWAVADQLYTPEVRAKFDIVGWDPRGVGRSTPLQCFPTTEEAVGALAPFGFPVTHAEEREWTAGNRAFVAGCRRNAGPIIDHMSTANVARDMDLLRRAVGDATMTFAGFSYGSAVGSWYANMFPNRVRAVVIDGVIDPVSYATGRGHEARYLPVDARLESEQGAYETLQGFFALCDAAGPGCAFSDGDPQQRYGALARRLLTDPVDLPDGEGGTVTVTYADLVYETLGAMYDAVSWPDLALALQQLDTAATEPAAATAWTALRARLAPPPVPEQPSYQQVYEGFAGVWCLDSDNPTRVSAWSRSARAADERWPYFGRAWIWGSSICADWSGRDGDRYRGPFDRRTANDVLVIGNRYDPATRYQDAVSTARTLQRSALITLEGWGHTSLFLSSCVDGYVSHYLLTGQAPRQDVTCELDVRPFADPQTAGRRATDARQFLLPPQFGR